MADTQRFYWIKLRTDFFDSEAVDWLISQKHGCAYVVLYLKMCLMTANKNGRLFGEVGEILIPYDAHKIARDTKFDIDTVVVALDLFKKLGLIYEEENGIITIPYVSDIVGSETKWAEYKRESRKLDNVQQEKLDIVQQENRYKRIDNRYIDNKSIEKKEKKFRASADAFVKPTVEEIAAYIKEKGYSIDAEYFYNYYESNGWIVGKTKMKNWKSAVANWQKRNKEYGNNTQDAAQSSYDIDEVEEQVRRKYQNL